MASVNTKAKQINGRDREASLLGPFFKSANCIPLEAFRRPLKANLLEQGFSSVFLYLLMNISGHTIRKVKFLSKIQFYNFSREIKVVNN